MALAAGWLSVGWIEGRKLDSSDEADASLSSAQAKMATKYRDRVERTGEAGILLWALFDRIDAENALPDLEVAADPAQAGRDAIEEHVADPSNAALLRIAKVRLEQWFKLDAIAALVFLNRSGLQHNLAVTNFGDVLRPLLERQNLATLISWVEQPAQLGRGPAQHWVMNEIATQLSKSGRVEDISGLLEKLDSSHQRTLMQAVLEKWPESSLSSFADFFRNTPEQLHVSGYLSRLKGTERMAWMEREIQENTPLSKYLLSSGAGRSAAAEADDLSTEERLAWFHRWSSDKQAPSADFLRERDIQRWFESLGTDPDDPLADWSHRFRSGQISAVDFLIEAGKAMPQYAKEDHDGMTSKIYKHLVKLNPTAAMEMIRQQPFQDREKSVVKATEQLAASASAAELYESVASIPPTVTSDANFRFSVWLKMSAPAYSRYGDSYNAWIRTLPHGVERDMALSALASHVEALDPQEAASLRAAKTLPVGWRPGQP